jgi:hypothetical protein
MLRRWLTLLILGAVFGGTLVACHHDERLRQDHRRALDDE